MHPSRGLKRSRALPDAINDELTKRSGFTPVPRNQIIQYLCAYDTVMDIRNASNICKKMMFSGGVQFGRVQYVIDNRDANQLSERWRKWAVTMWRYIDCCKFAAATFSNDQPDIPLCIPLEQIDIEIKKDTTGQLTFMYYAFDSNNVIANYGGGGRKPLTNIHTFFWDTNILDNYGNLMSTVAAILPEIGLYEFKKLMTKIADYSRANPCIITEAIPEKNNLDMLPFLPQTAALHGNGFAPADTSTALMPIGGGGNTNYEQARIPFGKEPKFPEDGKRVIPTPEHDNYAKAIDLPEGRKLVNGPIPEAPAELLNCQTANTEKIFLSWGIPLSMISNAASSGSMRNNTGQKGKGGGTSSGNSSSARMIFQAYQQDMKNFTITMVESMYNIMHMKKHFKQVKDRYAKENKKVTADNMHEYSDQILVTVSIPGQPNDDVLRELLTIGALKYDYYKQVTAHRYGIPLDAFNDKLEMTVQELNGIVEKDDTPPSKKAKS